MSQNPQNNIQPQGAAASFPWNRLPGELKDLVYEELLVSQWPVGCTSIEQPRGDQTNLYWIDEGWRICVETFTNLQTITLDGRNIGDLEKNVKTFAGWGGFPSL
ncbi:hypothetical protein SLS55_008372 [Diplodia seriata]|uniref:Uncharacterized protein n=1 Tax=Diplodia seriata TaxID=420778 RepID=A0ABR3CAC3_9PEZI